MNILYIGDIMAEPGRQVVERVLPALRKEHEVDFVIAQVENIDDDGKGPSLEHIEFLHQLGVDAFSGGNHSLLGVGSEQVYENETLPIVRPANFVKAIGKGYVVIDSPKGKVLVCSVLGQTVGSRQPELVNPLKAIDQILNTLSNEKIVAKVINFHGDFSSEKRVFGYYLDGRVSAVIGDHWHVPTADSMIMPNGTAHITDVGMCGALHSSLGVKTDVIVRRWKSGKPSRNEIEHEGPLQFNALLVDVDELTGLAASVEHIQRIVE